ncbi:hypothetical protein ABZ465_27940 [Streptomyces griseoincarnatus]
MSFAAPTRGSRTPASDCLGRATQVRDVEALAVCWAHGDHGRLTVALSVLEALTVAGLASRAVRFARAV